LTLSSEFDTEYIPGSENVLADALSRNTDDQITISANTIDIKLTGTDIEAAMLWQAEKRGKTIPSLNKQKQVLIQTHQKGHYGVKCRFKDLWNNGYWWPQIGLDRLYKTMYFDNNFKYNNCQHMLLYLLNMY
jgi:hypothetical protein